MTPHHRILGIAALACAFATVLTAAPQTTPPTAPVPLVLQNYKPVTAERLKNPEDGDWLMIRRTYDGWGYSPLDSDHAGKRAAAAAGLGVRDRSEQRPRGRAHREQRRDVRGDARQPGDCDRRQDRHDSLALSKAVARRRHLRSIPPAAAWRSTATRSSSRRATPFWSRSTLRPARKSGPPRSPRTRTATT